MKQHFIYYICFCIVFLSPSISNARISDTVFIDYNASEARTTSTIIDEPNRYYVDAAVKDLPLQRGMCKETVFHLFSHGKPGFLLLEGQWRNSHEIAEWLGNKDFLKAKKHLNIYGCNFGQGEKGRATVAYLEATLGISVAASDDVTGVDGDWDLEVGKPITPIQVLHYKSNLQKNGTLPVVPGMSVVTCFSGLAGNSTSTPLSTPNGYVLAIMDIREPDCDGSGNTNNGITPNAVNNWTDPAIGVYHHPSWTAANLGEISGVEIQDNVTAPNIYVASHGITGAALAPLTRANAPGATGGDVFRINGSNGAITHLTGLPNTLYTVGGYNRYVGLGNLAYNKDNDVLYVTNLDNGRIYVVNANTPGAPLDSYDHSVMFGGPADNNALLFTPLQRMVWGIAYNKNDKRLYYSVPTGFSGSAPNALSVYSVGLNADGTINENSRNLELTYSTNSRIGSGFEGFEFVMISDIEFSDNGSRMLLAERTLRIAVSSTNVLENEAHRSSTFLYTKSGTNWNLTTTYLVGSYQDKRNSFGGADFGYSNFGACGVNNACEDAVVIMADALRFSIGLPSVYGLQISDINGNSGSFPNLDYFIDLDGSTSTGENTDKFFLGDVDVVSGCNPCLGVTTIQPWNFDGAWIQDNTVSICQGGTFSIGSQAGLQNNIVLTLPNGSTDNTPDGNAFFTFSNATAANAGTYTLTYTDPATGCTDTQDFTVTINTINLDCKANVNDSGWQILSNCTVTLCPSQRLALAVNPSGLSSYQWSGPNGFSGAGDSNGNILISNAISTLHSGNYTVAVTHNGCTVNKTIQVTVNSATNAGTATNPAPICQGGSGLANVDLFGQLASETAGGIWSQTAGTAVGAALDTATGIFNPNGIGNGTYTFRYTVTGIASCPNDTEDVTITIQACCPPKICGTMTVTRN